MTRVGLEERRMLLNNIFIVINGFGTWPHILKNINYKYMKP
jgi:hypothetical protein